MENAYGIGVKNRYELFYDDEEDPIERIRQQEQELERKKTAVEKGLKGSTKSSNTPTTAKTGGKQANPAATVPAKKKDSTTSSRISDVPAGTEQAPRSRPPKPLGGERGPSKFGPRGGGGANEDQRDLEERKNRRNREERPPQTTGSEFRDRTGDEVRRGGRGGRGGGRGGPGRGRGRGGGMFDGRGKREFDRQSGSDKSAFSSGVKPTEKRDGGGAHNWGTVKDDMENSFNMSNEEPTETAERSGDEEITENPEPKEGEEAPAAPEEGTGEDGLKTEDEGTKEMTLDEWKKEQEQKRSVPKFNLRKAGEGEDSGWQKKVFVLKKKENEEDDDEETEDEEDEILRRGRQKQVVDIEINFVDSRRGRGRGRGGPRGGMGGPGGRGGRGGFNRGGSGGGGGGGGGMRDGGPPRERDREREGDSSSWADRERDRDRERGPRDREGGKGGKGSQQAAPKVDDWNDFPSLVAA